MSGFLALVKAEERIAKAAPPVVLTNVAAARVTRATDPKQQRLSDEQIALHEVRIARFYRQLSSIPCDDSTLTSLHHAGLVQPLSDLGEGRVTILIDKLKATGTEQLDAAPVRRALSLAQSFLNRNNGPKDRARVKTTQESLETPLKLVQSVMAETTSRAGRNGTGKGNGAPKGEPARSDMPDVMARYYAARDLLAELAWFDGHDVPVRLALADELLAGSLQAAPIAAAKARLD